MQNCMQNLYVRLYATDGDVVQKIDRQTEKHCFIIQMFIHC